MAIISYSLHKLSIVSVVTVSTVLICAVFLAQKTYAAEGNNSFDSIITNNQTPILSGAVPVSCGDVYISIISDDDNTPMYIANSGNAGVIVDSNGSWSADFSQIYSGSGLKIANGFYDVVVGSCFNYSTWQVDNEDYFYDSLYVVPDGCDEQCVPIHRFYNLNNGAHFYTANENEKRQIINNSLFRYEGIASFGKKYYESPATFPGSPGTSAVHRFYKFKEGVHFYTSSQSEATFINNNLYGTYRYEGVAYYTFNAPVPNSSPVHRFYKFKQGVHFYTSNQNEATYINNNLYNTYRYEGVSYYNIANTD